MTDHSDFPDVPAEGGAVSTATSQDDVIEAMKDVVDPEPDHRDAPGAAVVDRAGIGQIIVLGDVGEVTGVHESGLMVFEMDESGRIPIA